jgi:thiamine-monophosphate kinase
MAGKRKTLAETGEYEFIRRIRGMMPVEGEDIVRSAGDDCLVVKSPGKMDLLLTTDTFVEHVHFNRDYAGFKQIGNRCMAATVSDIAAMAGFPRYSLASLSLPRAMVFDDAVGLFSGLQKAAEYYGCPVAGGETTASPGPVTITITVLGTSVPGKEVYRRGARPGDSIYVTGSVGDAMGGLLAFQRDEAEYDSLKEKYLSPTAHVILARSLVEIYTITSMIDLSDGIATDCSHICEESLCGARIDEDALPISADLRRLCAKHGLNVTEFALSSGEDYELLFTSSDRSLAASFRFLNQSITRIGQIVDAAEGFTIRRTGGEVEPVAIKGYEHFIS